MRKAVRLAEIHQVVTASFPLLRDINDNFTPNGGDSFYDYVKRSSDTAVDNSRRLERLEEGQAAMLNMMEEHILHRQVNGQRSTDT